MATPLIRKCCFKRIFFHTKIVILSFFSVMFFLYFQCLYYISAISVWIVVSPYFTFFNLCNDHDKFASKPWSIKLFQSGRVVNCFNFTWISKITYVTPLSFYSKNYFPNLEWPTQKKWIIQFSSHQKKGMPSWRYFTEVPCKNRIIGL